MGHGNSLNLGREVIGRFLRGAVIYVFKGLLGVL